MTNDTSTLMGALKEAGETLAANLTTQGVPSTWDEGLTTLIGKVLDITPGPTPGFDGIDLSSDKDILSAYDSESATLTAQLLNGSSPALVAGETVSFEVRKTSDDSLVETLTGTTNASGIATVSYLGQGTGDIYIKSNVDSIISSETYELEDCVKYDITEHTKSYSSTQFETIESITDLSDCSISLDLKSTTYSWSCVFGISYNSESDQIGFGTTDSTAGKIYRTLNGANNHVNYSGFNSHNVYFNLRFERVGTTLKLYLNDNLIDTSTDNEISSFKYLNFGSWRNKTIYYKNIKIKPL